MEDEKGEVVTIDSYAEKFKSMKASAAAVKVPLIPINSGNVGGNASKGGAKQGQGQKRQSEDTGWNRDKRQNGAKKGSSYKPFTSSPSSRAGAKFQKK